MSRSYKRYYRMHMCTGNNTPWYKNRRRKTRRKLNLYLKTLVDKHYIEDINDVICFPGFVTTDHWAEPSDGHWVMTKQQVCDRFKKWDKEYWKKIYRTLKPKRRHGYEK